MAERRMFAKSVVDSDSFMSLPFSAQAAYLHLAMRADDDGFIGNSKSILRMIGGSEEEFNLLVKEGFIRIFDSGVVAIVHWKVNNYIQKDRYKPSVYRKERELMYPKKNKKEDKVEEKPEDKKVEENFFVSDLDTQDRLGKDRSGKDSSGKDRLGKVSSESGKVSTDKDNTDEDNSETPQVTPAQSREFLGVPENECVKIIDLYNSICTTLPKVQGATSERKHNIALLMRKYTPQQIEEVFAKAQECDFLCGKGERGWKASFDWLIREDNFIKVYEGVYDCSVKSLGESETSYDLEAYEKYSMFD